jgi:hypothetical protein
MENKIELKSIGELLRMNFFIPSYQRGYRWTKQQVKDLLDDIQEFVYKKQEGFYCIQPLVVKREIPNEKKKEFKEKLNTIEEKGDILQEAENIISDYTKWEVIDGQQRLTTIYILLSYLGKTNYYQMEYETRNDSKSFLEEIDPTMDMNIDYFHMMEAKKQIKCWFSEKYKETKEEEFKNTFLENLLKNVKFIWYESINENPIKVFTRLNIGKISLTNAELIKALFLNKSNFSDYNYQKIRLQQQKIATEWDNIEFTLQNDEFWLFLNNPEYIKPTRIDFIFDLMCEKNTLELTDKEKEETGTDDYKTFRYFYIWFKKKEEKDILECWQKIKGFFQIFQEWYNDLDLYHYIGFLIENNIKVSDILDEWDKINQTKEDFQKRFIIPRIKEKLNICSDLNKQYEVPGSPKTQCRPILLLHNIQTVINQNKNLKENEKYKLSIFYKFPFHLFKKEKWDVEHIDSHSENPLEREKEQREWLKYSYDHIGKTATLDSGENLRAEIGKFIERNTDKKEFFELWNGVRKAASSNSEKLIDRKTDAGITINEKDMLWNFTLLDSSTNRSYGNDIFPSKRRFIIAKDQGKRYEINDNLEIKEVDGVAAFVPPCTKHVFLKYFNHSTNNLREWDKPDAVAYLDNIKTVLNIFFEKEIEYGK